MLEHLFIGGFIALSLSFANASDGVKVAPTKKAKDPIVEIPTVIETFKVSGNCPKIEYEKTKTCTNSGDDEYQSTFTLYKFEPKPSNAVKTIAKACPRKLIESSLKLPEQNVSRLVVEPDKFNDIKSFRVKSCTLLEYSPSLPKLAIIENEQKNTEGTSQENASQSKITFVKVDDKDTPQKIIKVIHSTSPFMADREFYSDLKICDTDSDGRADVLLEQLVGFDAKYKIINVDANVDEISIDSWLADQNCDHTAGD